MVLDGEATIGIAIDEAQCEDVRDPEFEHVIKVGGEKGPTLIPSHRVRRASRGEDRPSRQRPEREIHSAGLYLPGRWLQHPV